MDSNQCSRTSVSEHGFVINLDCLTVINEAFAVNTKQVMEPSEEFFSQRNAKGDMVSSHTSYTSILQDEVI